MKLGIIEEGKLKGKKMILEPRENMEENLYLVESGKFIDGQTSKFSLQCLTQGCEQEVPGKCGKCNK